MVAGHLYSLLSECLRIRRGHVNNSNIMPATAIMLAKGVMASLAQTWVYYLYGDQLLKCCALTCGHTDVVVARCGKN